MQETLLANVKILKRNQKWFWLEESPRCGTAQTTQRPGRLVQGGEDGEGQGGRSGYSQLSPAFPRGMC